MDVYLDGVYKRYRYKWVLKDVSMQLSGPGTFAVSGPNGSGKSTFLQLLCGYLSPSKGKISWTINNCTLPIDKWYRHISFAAPYIDLVEDFTLPEMLRFHQKLKGFSEGLSVEKIQNFLALDVPKGQFLKDYSSGMKQRVKLIMAILSKSKMLLLDEPGTNLDDEGKDWYRNLLSRYQSDRLVIVASNDKADFPPHSKEIQILDYK